MYCITRLCELLNEAGLNYVHFARPEFSGDQITLIDNDNNYIDDAICHNASHGASVNLLETYKLNNCEGNETPEEVAEGWIKMMKELGINGSKPIHDQRTI